MPSRTSQPRRNLNHDMDTMAAELKRIRDELDQTQQMIDTLSRMFDEEKLAYRLDMRRLREAIKPLGEF